MRNRAYIFCFILYLRHTHTHTQKKKKKKKRVRLEWDKSRSRSKRVGDTLSFLMKWLDINEVKIRKRRKTIVKVVRDRKSKEILCPQHFYNIFTTNPK